MPDYTQDHSIPHPAPGDPIRGSTSDYILTDLRDLARGTDSAITAAVNTRAPLSHTHTQSQVDGLPAALDAAGDTAQWGSVSGKPETFPPATHTHTVAQVDGLDSQLAELTYWSDRRDISGAFVNGWTGAATIVRKGFAVTLHLEGMNASASTGTACVNVPTGFRPISMPGSRVIRTLFTAGGSPSATYQADIDSGGWLRIFVPSGASLSLSGDFTYFTNDSIPSTLPGDPA